MNKRGKWIPVSERQPDLNDNDMVAWRGEPNATFRELRINSITLFLAVDTDNELRYAVGRFTNSDKRPWEIYWYLDYGDEVFPNEKVTHWMIPPKLPDLCNRGGNY
jgi:hypothetical protein